MNILEKILSHFGFYKVKEPVIDIDGSSVRFNGVKLLAQENARSVNPLFMAETEDSYRDDIYYSLRFLPNIDGGVRVHLCVDSVGAPIMSLKDLDTIKNLETSIVVSFDEIPQLYSNLMMWHTQYPYIKVAEN